MKVIDRRLSVGIDFTDFLISRDFPFHYIILFFFSNFSLFTELELSTSKFNTSFSSNCCNNSFFSLFLFLVHGLIYVSPLITPFARQRLLLDIRNLNLQLLHSLNNCHFQHINTLEHNFLHIYLNAIHNAMMWAKPNSVTYVNP